MDAITTEAEYEAALKRAQSLFDAIFEYELAHFEKRKPTAEEAAEFRAEQEGE